MGKKRAIKNEGVSLADIPFDVRNIIAQYVERTWFVNSKGIHWPKSTYNYLANRIEKSLAIAQKRTKKVADAIWFLSVDRQRMIIDIANNAASKLCNDRTDRHRKEHGETLRLKRDMALRAALLVRKCKRA